MSRYGLDRRDMRQVDRLSGRKGQMRFEEVVVRNPVTASVTFQPAGNLLVEIVVAVNEAGTQDADVVAFCTAK